MNADTAQTDGNVDSAELDKFSALASRWWDPASEFKPLHDINPLRVDFIRQRVDLKARNVLDVGCGGGLLTEGLATLGAEVSGIDLSEQALVVARLHLKESGLNVCYERVSAENYAATHAGKFDVVTCMELLEHVPDPCSTVQACARLVRPGGAVFFSTINRNPKSWLFAIVGAEYVLNLLPKGTHDFRKLIKPSELEGWARTAGLSARELTGMHYSPLTGKYRLGPGVDVNYLGMFVKPGSAAE